MSAQTGALKPLKAGTSGFRGKTYEEVTPEHARVIGFRYGLWLIKQGEVCPMVTVGHDQRRGARELAEAVMQGLVASRVNVSDIGMVSTGLFTYAMLHRRHAGGVLVTGSHMPHDRIGIIAINADSTYATSEVTDFISAGFTDYEPVMAMCQDSVQPSAAPDTTGLEEQYSLHMKYLFERKGFDMTRCPITDRKFRVVVDSGNGTMGRLTRRTLEMFGVAVSGLYMDPQEVPRRGSECTPENCADAISATKTSFYGKNDLGIAFDGDGDRGMFISPTKGALDGDIVAGIFGKWMLREGALCVTPVSTGALLNHVAREASARVELCRVGQPATGAATKFHNATFYCEAASQKFGFSQYSFGYDALYSLLMMLEIMAVSGKSIDELVDELPVFYRREKVLRLERVAHGDREKSIADALTTARRHFGDDHHGAVCDIDGLRFDFDDGSWVLMRPSGTEPVVRVYGSGQDAERVETLVREGAAIFRKHLGLDLND